MASTFDTGLTEFSYLINCRLVHIYKVGGGTIGRRYQGRWGYRVTQGGATIASGEDLQTATPKTHAEAAALAVGMAVRDTSGENFRGAPTSKTQA